MKLDYILVSETGMRRSNNEDAILFLKPDKPWIEQAMGSLAIIADGMGGHSKGEKASLLATEIIAQEYYKKITHPLTGLQNASLKANNAIASEGDLFKNGMGTTCTATAIVGNKIFVLHIGDSRCYLIKKDKLKLVTTDHTVENEMTDNSSQFTSQNKHVLTKSLGSEMLAETAADVFLLDDVFDVNDKIFLCTDGVNGHISDFEIQKLFEESKTIKEVSKKIIKTVLNRGAFDNFSFIIVERKS